MMPMLDYHNRRFRSISNDGSGDVSAETEFHYRQKGRVVSATYRGGGVRYGMLIALASDDGRLDARYQHVNADGCIMTGVCNTTPERLPDGRLRLHESWRWTCGDRTAGHSIVEEIRNNLRDPPWISVR